LPSYRSFEISAVSSDLAAPRKSFLVAPPLFSAYPSLGARGLGERLSSLSGSGRSSAARRVLAYF